MELQSASLTGDPLLKRCLNNETRIQSGDDGLSVKRVQAALIAVGRSVGPAGADGVFGPSTGNAVSEYKTIKGLAYTDPVVGQGTTAALDADLFFDPPTLDPNFGEFSSFVVSRRLEQFVALELSTFLNAPPDSWRHMLGKFALKSLTTGELLGIVAGSRANDDIRQRFIDEADHLQRSYRPAHPGLITAEEFFNDEIVLGPAGGSTVTYTVQGTPRSFIVLQDNAILERGLIERKSTHKFARETLMGIVAHELTHVRNVAGTLVLESIADSDADTYVDTNLAAACSAAGRETSDVLRSFVHEMTARHVGWIVRQELAGTPGDIALNALTAQQLAKAAWFYFVDTHMFDRGGYVEGIRSQGNGHIFEQLGKWLNHCAHQYFSDTPAQDELATLAFEAAARECADRAVAPVLLPADTENGVWPLPQDFVI